MLVEFKVMSDLHMFCALQFEICMTSWPTDQILRQCNQGPPRLQARVQAYKFFSFRTLSAIYSKIITSFSNKKKPFQSFMRDASASASPNNKRFLCIPVHETPNSRYNAGITTWRFVRHLTLKGIRGFAWTRFRKG
jgi:hypothetical protein